MDVISSKWPGFDASWRPRIPCLLYRLTAKELLSGLARWEELLLWRLYFQQ